MHLTIRRRLFYLLHLNILSLNITLSLKRESLPGDYMPGVPPVPIPNTVVKPRAANGSRTLGPARVGCCQVYGPNVAKAVFGPSFFLGDNRSSSGELGRGHFTERTVRALVVVVFAERFEQFPGVSEVDELMFVETFVAKLSVEAFDVRVLRGFSRSDEAVVDLPFVRSAVQGETGKFRAVVGEPTLRPPAQFAKPVEHADNAVARQRGVGLDPQALAGVVVDDREHP